jgi:uncharacterized membrane protein (DUF4010 family)
MVAKAQILTNRLNATKIELCSTLSLLALSFVEGPALRSRVLSRPSTSIENALQISSFMQNKPNVK